MPSIDGLILSRSCGLLIAGCFLAFASATGCDGDGNDAAPSATQTPQTRLQTAEPVRLYAAEPGDEAGSIATGDFNGDGQVDVALAAAFADGPSNDRPDAGEVYIFLGPLRPADARDAARGEQALTIFGARAGDQAGRSLTAGDFNGDHVDDVALGSPFSDGPVSDRPDAGRVDVWLGSAAAVSKKALDLADGADMTVYGASAGDLAGIALTTGRLTDDEMRDLVIGAFWAAGPGEARPMAGEVYAIFGSPSLPRVMNLSTTPPNITVFGAATEDRLGEGVATGDVNGDGLDDMVLPAPFAASPSGVQDAGRTYVIASPAPPSIDLSLYSPVATIYGVDDGDQLGHVPVAADFDGDGRSDLLLTAVSADGPGNTVNLAGEAAVIMSTSLGPQVNGVPGAVDAIIYGEGREHRLGRSAGAADIDGDGAKELLMGAPGAPSADGAALAGRLYVIQREALAKEMRLPDGAMIFYGEDAGDSLTSEVFGRLPLQGADMDGDGREEVLVVAPLGDGPGNGRKDCGEALILFITGDIPR